MTSRDERASESKVRLYLLARQLVKSSARASEFSLVLAKYFKVKPHVPVKLCLTGTCGFTLTDLLSLFHATLCVRVYVFFD